MFLKCRALTMTDFVDDTELEEEVSDAVVPHASHATTPRDAPPSARFGVADIFGS